MSFVYAEKNTAIDQEIITIHSDTKIKLPDDAKSNFSVEEIDLIKKYGIIKFSIIGPTICIAFAGNKVFLAARLFSQLSEMKTFSVEEAIKKAYAVHKSADCYNDIEFIICSADDNDLRIDCIKDGSVQNDCCSAWLGSYDAFREFQRIRISDSSKTPAELTDSAFQSVVQGCGDDSVGGFYISASYRPDLNCFWYSERLAFHSSNEQTVKSGEAIKFFLDSSNGGFSYRLIPCKFDSLLMDVDQMEPMILYSRGHRLSESDSNNSNLFGLMLPMLVKRTENGEIVRC